MDLDAAMQGAMMKIIQDQENCFHDRVYAGDSYVYRFGEYMEHVGVKVCLDCGYDFPTFPKR